MGAKLKATGFYREIVVATNSRGLYSLRKSLRELESAMCRPLFAIRLEAKRRSLGLTQEALAEKLNVSSITIFRWEKGASLPEGKHVSKLIEELEFNHKELGDLFEQWILKNETSRPSYSIRGYEYVDANFEDWSKFLDHLIDIDVRSIPNMTVEHEGTAEQWAPIFKNNPYTWKLLTFNDVIVGYWHYIPLKESVFKAAVSGDLLESDLSDDMVEFLVEAGNYRMFISMIVVEPAHRNPAATSILKESFIKEISNLARRGFFFSDICACAFSPVGIDLCNLLGMDRVGRHNKVSDMEVSEVYYLDGKQICSRGIFKSNKRLAALYAKNFSS